MCVSRFLGYTYILFVLIAILVASSEIIHWALFGEWWHVFVTPEGKSLF